jgi:CRISPR system Cascade subunit CasB
MEAKIVWTAESGLGKGLRQWWSKLENDRGTRAMLRRCSTLDEVVMSPAYQHFYRYMLACGWPGDAAERQNDKLAAIAALAAMVKDDDTADLPFRMSEKEFERPLLSELRFRALLKIDTTDELLTGLRRALPLIGHKTNLVRLAHDVYWWNDDTKKKWAYAYRWPPKTSA